MTMQPQLPVRVQLTPALKKAVADLRWAESKPTPNQVRGLAALLSPLLAILGILALVVAAIFGARGKKGMAGAAGLAGIGAMGTAAVGGVTAAKPETLLDPRAARVIADPRASQVKGLGEAAQRLESAGPAIAQALLEANSDELSMARQRGEAWKRERAHLEELATELDKSLRVVGPLGTLTEDDGAESIERAQQILDRLDQQKLDRALEAAAEAEVEALGEPGFGAERLRELQADEQKEDGPDPKARAAAAQRKRGDQA